MSKIQYDPNSELAKYFVKTEVDGPYIRHDTDSVEYVINSETGEIILRSRWKYAWLKDYNVKDDWTLTEKSLFISKVSMAISDSWNGKIVYSVSGYSDFTKKFQGRQFPLRIEIIPVDHNEHWNVTVTKVNPDVDRTTFVQSGTRFIQLDSNDVVAVERCTGQLQVDCRSQVAVSHEFGHVIFNDDEYIQPHLPAAFNSGYLHLNRSGNVQFKDSDTVENLYGWDADGLMSVGTELRERYLRGVTVDLNIIMPDTYFHITSVKH